MKKILSFSFLVLFFAAMMVSCDDDSSPNIDVAAINTTQESMAKEVPSVTLTQDEMILLTELSNGSPKLSQEQAMEIANNFLNKGTTSSLSKRGTAMPRCEVLTRAKQRISKSGTATDEVDTMLYVFNYDEGYAVVSADVRVSEQVLAFSDEGNIHLDADNPYIDMFMDMAVDYIDSHIADAELIKDSVENTLMEKIQIALGMSIDTLQTLSKAVREVERFLLTCQCGYYERYKSSTFVGPYIRTYWDQWSPYNDSVPLIKGKRCPAGCNAIAFAQLIAFWKYPSCYDNGIIIDWTAIKKAPKSYSVYDKGVVADFVHKVGVAIHTYYALNGSTAYMKNGVVFLKEHGYTTYGVKDYSIDKIKKSLDNKRPVVIVGYNIAANGNHSAEEGHTWLIDGYAKIEYERGNRITYVVITEDDATGRRNGELEAHYTSWSNPLFTYYHHFNWGWGDDNNTLDNSNGYYYEGVFDVQKEYQVESNKEPKPKRNWPVDVDYNFQYSIQIATDIHR